MEEGELLVERSAGVRSSIFEAQPYKSAEACAELHREEFKN